MRHTRLHPFLGGVLAGFLAGGAGVSQADDTEIYLQSIQSTDTIRPNVLMILDTSDSMNREVTGTGKSRLENMRIAMVSLIQGLDNVNVGLMRFTGHRNPNNPDPYVATGGSVIFPISNLDAPAGDITGEPDDTVSAATRQVDASSDDAEEASDNSMSLNDSVIELVERPAAAAGTQTIEVKVTASTDDALEKLGDGNVVKTGGKRIAAVITNNSNNRVGLRFRNVTVPGNATISHASLSFVSTRDKANAYTMRITAHKVLDPAGFTNNATSEVSGRSPVTASADWAVDPWSKGDVYIAATTSVDISAIVQELIDQSGWDGSTKDMVFMLQEVSGQTREFAAWDCVGDPGAASSPCSGGTVATGTYAPKLTITYSTPGSSADTQTIGLRFDDLQVPQGATVSSAYIDFIGADPSDNSDGTVSFAVQDADDAATYTASASNITAGGRSYAGAVSWSPGAAVLDDVMTSPDLKSLVQTVVDRTGFCGGNAIAFKVTGSGTKAFKSFDDDPAKAPVLRVSYDATAIPEGQGCIKRTYVYQTAHSKDDARETVSTGATSLSGDLRMAYHNGNQLIIGMRFPGVTINPGTTIEKAELEFTAFAAGSDSTTLTINGHDGSSAPRFESSTNNISDTASRPRTSASVAWTPDDVEAAGDVFSSPDIKTIVQEIVDRDDWLYNNAMGFYITGSGTAARRAKSFNNDPLYAPRLKITVEESWGGGSGGQKTVRQRLVELVNELVFTTNRTPSQETLYEGALYWRGDPVLYGKKRGVQNDGMKVTRVSHPGSYTGGTLTPADGSCSFSNDLSCKTEEVTGDPVYISPLGTQECQQNYQIFLSDGAPTQNGAIELSEALIGESCGDNPKGNNGKCGNELMKYLHTVDQNDDSDDGDQTVTTYTVGFNVTELPDPLPANYSVCVSDTNATVQYMCELASNGGGEFVMANTASELVTELSGVFSDILSNPTSFAAPALSVNAFNKLFHREDVYFALFKPSASTRWTGNVKKYSVCDDSTQCTLGEILDANDVSAIDSDSRIKADALSFWSETADGPTIELGGAGGEVTDYTGRTIYTDVGLDAQPSGSVALDVDAQRLTSSSYDNSNVQAIRTAACTDGTIGNSDCNNLLQWMLGRDVVDEDSDLATTDTRWGVADTLHSSPVVVTYGKDGTDYVDKVFVGTNEGALHMINGYNGKEEWIFVPAELLDNQEHLYNNPEGDHTYGLDLTPVPWVKDVDNDGIIEPADGDFVRIIVGMRRGGRSYYALDVTQASGTAMTKESTSDVTPKFMWRIEGGSTDYARLGQTWSEPIIGDIRYGNGDGSSTSKTVMLIGGGYEEALDEGFGTTPTAGNPNLGNAIYIVDPEDGSRIRWISSDASADISVTGMDYAIPSTLAVYDASGDGELDRIYVGDTAGNVWRVDLGPTLSDTSNGGTVVGKLATISTAGTPADERRIFYPPDVVQVQDSVYSSISRYDLVIVVTGNRAHPLDTDVQNRVYAMRDYSYSGLSDESPGDNLADDYPKETGDALVNSDFVDVTDNDIQEGDEEDAATALADLQASYGWRLDLEGSGEKSLATPLVLSGKLFFTTYLPDATTSACQAQEGAGLLYGVNVLTAAAVLNFDDSDEVLDKSDRSLSLGGGIPSAAVPIFQPEGITLIVGTGGGAVSVDPEVDLPRRRTYWYQD